MAEINPISSLEEIEKEIASLNWSYERLDGETSSLLIDTPYADCLVELYSDGRFAIQFGVDMEEMRSLLTGDQTEDMADDELVRVARYHLKPIVDHFRPPLLREGMEEGVDATPHFYAVTFSAKLDLSDPKEAVHRMAAYLLALEKAA